MNKFATNLGTILTDNHIRLPGLAVVALKIVAVVWPQYEAKCTAIEELIGVYMIGHATNSSPGTPPSV